MTTTNVESKFKRSPCPATYGFNPKGEVKPVYCKRWTCPNCARRNARKWARRIKARIVAGTDLNGEKWHMLTLTMGSKYHNPADAYRDIPRLWARLRQWCRRQGGNAWVYAAFVEGQENRRSMPHFHILTPRLPRECYGARGKVTKHATHRFANSLGWGYQALAEPVTSQRAASYVTKYVSKGSGTIPKGFRRVRVSKDIDKIPLPEGYNLIVMRGDETFAEFIDRASTETGIAHEILVGRWFETKHKGDVE